MAARAKPRARMPMPRPSAATGRFRSTSCRRPAATSMRPRWWWRGSAMICVAAKCEVRPGVETPAKVTTAGHMERQRHQPRSAAHVVSTVDGGPAYGGTPSDASVIRAIQDFEGARPEGGVLSLHPDGHCRRAMPCLIPMAARRRRPIHGVGASPQRSRRDCLAPPTRPLRLPRRLQAFVGTRSACRLPASA